MISNTKYLLLKVILFILFIILFQSKVVAVPFTDNGNGTITDNATGLIWQKTSSTTNMNWWVAIDYCNSLSLAGRTWRLPNINELISVVVPTADFPYNGEFWSSTTSYLFSQPINSMHISAGNVRSIDKHAAIPYAKCVSGP